MLPASLKIILSVLVILLLTCQGSFAETQKECLPYPSVSPESYLELFRLLKNDVLGTLPKFCQETNNHYLKKTDEGEEAFDQHVIKLRANHPSLNSEKITIEFLEEVIFKTFHYVILKKMWHLSSYDTKYKILLSNDCQKLGINRFPLDEDDIRVKKNEESVEKESALFFKTQKICETKRLEDLAAFMSRDVMAESLLYLKDIFPVNFESVLTSLCIMLKASDELVFKNESYESYYVENFRVSSEGDFSSWLRSLYLNNRDSNDKKIIGAGIEKMILAHFQAQTSDHKRSVELTRVERIVLDYYTGDDFYHVNNCLRKNDCSESQMILVDGLVSALDRLKVKAAGDRPYKTVFRGMTNLPESALEALEKAKTEATEIDKGFMSTSGRASVADGFSKGENSDKKGYIYILRAKSCVGISAISNVKAEDEFLCPPGLKFRLKTSFPKEGKMVYVLEESF